jgi:hypothetical protein
MLNDECRMAEGNDDGDTRPSAFPLFSIPHSSFNIRRSGRIIWPAVVFLLGFAVLLVIVCHWYLFPALEAAQRADPVGRRQLGATARLMLAVVLFILLAGLLMSFRVGRFFLPRRREPKPRPTTYPDAWAESARRVKMPEE